MLAQRKLILSLALAMSTASARADILYVVTYLGQFGTINTGTGGFTQIGPMTSDPLAGLVPGPNGTYLGVSFAGNLDSVNPTTGAISVIGPTGLGSSALNVAELNGTLYETDFGNNLYTINATTGAASLVGHTGIPAAPADPADLFDNSFFGAAGHLYETFDAFNATTLALVNNPALYQINPTTGVATLVGPTTFQINAAVDVNGTVYVLTAGGAGGIVPSGSDQILSLNVANGSTTFLATYDASSTFFATGAAAAAPEPSYFALVGLGIGGLLIYERRRRRL
jgi:hypothetical protein